MGCDIHAYVEVRGKYDRWELAGTTSDPFGGLRSYELFAWLAGVRNYSEVQPLSDPRGIPNDASPEVESIHNDWLSDAHSASWFSLRELLDVDYKTEIEDRRWNGAATCKPGKGEKMSLFRFLPDHYFVMLALLATLGPPENVRIIFWFDN